MRSRSNPQIPGVGRSDPGVPSRWLFHYHPEMVAAPLLQATPVARMTIGEDFVRDHVRIWAPDLISFPLLSPEFCRFLLDAAAALDTDAPTVELDRITPRLSDIVTQIVGRHVNPLLRRLFLGMHVMAQVETPKLERRGPDTPPDERLELERGGNLGFVVALSGDHQGGGLRFPRQEVVVDELGLGHALMIPHGPSHLYARAPITAGLAWTLAFKTRSEDADDD